MIRIKYIVVGILLALIFCIIYIPFVPIQKLYPEIDDEIIFDGMIRERIINYKTAFFLHKGKHFNGIPCVENKSVYPTDIVFNWDNSISVTSDAVNTALIADTVYFQIYTECPEGAFRWTSYCTYEILVPDSLIHECDAIYFSDTKGNYLKVVKKQKNMPGKDVGFLMKIDGKVYRTGKESIFDY